MKKYISSADNKNPMVGSDGIYGSGYQNLLGYINEARDTIEAYKNSSDFDVAGDLLAEAKNTNNTALRDLILDASKDLMLDVEKLIHEFDMFIKSLDQEKK